MNVDFDHSDDLVLTAEEAHLLRSPANARRLLSALKRALANEGETASVENLRLELGLADEA